jgi:hypothetical protein
LKILLFNDILDIKRKLPADYLKVVFLRISIEHGNEAEKYRTYYKDKEK